MQSKKFRADINGLRAIAVLSVVFFHFNPGLVPGGFAGVDVFFVISGFLMTSIIFRGLENNNFSLWNFLKARARRIVPALVAVISIVLSIGYLFFEPLTYQLAGKHGFSSLLFISNITYANEAGYFDADSFSKLFLHTWSLSVEWQFYIVYPIILIILSKLFSINTLKKIVLISVIISFAFCVYFTSINKTLSYFMIYTRAWEMLFGGVAFLFPLSTTENKKRIVEVIGLISICTSFFIFSDADNWPSYNALLPVFGAYLCILSNCKKTLLSNVLFQKIGLWSYSIYLVHWPVLTVTDKLNLNLNIYTYLITTYVLSTLLYSLVEKRRDYGKSTLLLYIFVLTASAYISINGINIRVSEKYRLSSKEYHEKYFGGIGFETSGNAIEYNKGSGSKKYILVGDSFARQYARFFFDKKINFIGIFTDGCFSSKEYISTSGGVNHKLACARRYDNLISEMKKNPDAIVVYAQRWDHFKVRNKENNTETMSSKIATSVIDEIIHYGGDKRKYIIVGMPPLSNGYSYYECSAKENLMMNKVIKTKGCDEEVSKENSQINKVISNHISDMKAIFVDAYGILCKNKICTVVDENKNPIYSDDVHLSIYGANIIGNSILSEDKNP